MRKLSKALTLMGLLAPVGVNALGVGEIKLHSALNQVLKAEIPLITSASEANSDIKVNLASPSAFAQAGIERPYFLSRLRFTPVVENGRVVVKVSSNDVIREPFLNFLLEVNWPNGRTLREFIVLLDPPATFDEKTITAVRAPRVQSTTVAESRYPVDRPSTGFRPKPSAVWRPRPQAEKKTPDFVRSRVHDTLWALAIRANTGRPVSHTQMMIALYKANPHAFFKNNINALKARQRLRIPSREVISRTGRRQAVSEYQTQNDQWRGLVASSDTTKRPSPESQVKPAGGRQTASESPVKLELVPTDSGKPDATGSGQDPALGKSEIAPEVIDSIRQENVELRGRLNEAEDQLKRVKQLLVLKDQQLGALQASRQPGETDARKAIDASVAKPAADKVPLVEPGTDQHGLDKPATDHVAKATAAQPSADQPVTDAIKPAHETGSPPDNTVASVEIPAQAKTTPTAESGMDSTKKENVTHEGQRRAQSPNSDQSSVVPDQVVAGPAAPIEPLTTNEPPPIEPATPVATRSKPAKSDSKPVEEQYSLLHELLSEPDYLKIGGGVAFLLGLIGWVLVRRSNRKMLEDQESLLDSSFSHSDDSDNEGDQKTVYIPVSENTRTVKSSFLSELAPSAFDALETGHEVVDPVSEADVCLAYGRYQQAKDLIRNAIETYPERDEYKLKLLEIHFVTEDREAFEQYAKTLEYLNQERPKLWAKVVALGRELCPENALFKPAESAYRNNALDFEDSLNDGNHSIESDDATSDAVSEFSDLTDMDEIETKLDLAKAYFEMDDQESARAILSEILIEGNDEQKNEARALVDLLDHKV